jgi:hypothetical protein
MATKTQRPPHRGRSLTERETRCRLRCHHCGYVRWFDENTPGPCNCPVSDAALARAQARPIAGGSEAPVDATYLGDSVYVRAESGMIELLTWNGYADDPRNRIYLEPEVYQALLTWVADQQARSHVEG